MDISITVISQGNTAKKMKLIREKLSDSTTRTTQPTSVTCCGFEQRYIRSRISGSRDRLTAACRGEKKQKVVIRTRSKRKRFDKNDEYENDKTKRYGRLFDDGVITFSTTTDVAFDQQSYEMEPFTNINLNKCCMGKNQCSNKDSVVERLLRYGFSSTNNCNDMNNDDLEKSLYKTLEKFEQLRFANGDNGPPSCKNDFYCQLLPTITEEVMIEEKEEVMQNKKEDNYEYEETECEPFYWNEVSFPEDFYENTCCFGDGYIGMCDQQHVYECVEQMER